MQIRPYAELDAPVTLSVFISAITETAAIHYAPDQIEAWSRPQERDANQWNSARLSLNTVVATIGGEIAGFSDVSESGYIDMMFVAPRFGRQSVASALLSHLHEKAVADGLSELWTHASITARPFFERHGFVVTAERHPITRGVRMVNYQMTRQLVP